MCTSPSNFVIFCLCTLRLLVCNFQEESCTVFVVVSNDMIMNQLLNIVVNVCCHQIHAILMWCLETCKYLCPVVASHTISVLPKQHIKSEMSNFYFPFLSCQIFLCDVEAEWGWECVKLLSSPAQAAKATQPRAKGNTVKWVRRRPEVAAECRRMKRAFCPPSRNSSVEMPSRWDDVRIPSAFIGLL